MVFTYSLTNNIGKVRLLIPDRVESGHILEDDEITVMLTMEGDVVKRAAALALEMIAADEALTMKAAQLLELRLDGPAVARALLERAARLRQQADAEEAQAEDGGFDVAEQVVDPFSWRQRVYNQALREGI